MRQKNASVLRVRVDENVALLFTSCLTLAKFLISPECPGAYLKTGVHPPECCANSWGRGCDVVALRDREAPQRTLEPGGGDVVNTPYKTFHQGSFVHGTAA